MTFEVIANWFTGFAEAYFVYLLFETFLKRREGFYGIVYISGVVLLGVMTNLCNTFLHISVMNLAVILALYILMSYLYEGKFSLRILSSAMSMMIGVVIEVVVLLLLAALFNKESNDIINEAGTRILGIFLSKLFCFAIIKYISIKFKKNILKFDITYWVLFAVLFCSTTFTMFTFCKVTEMFSDVYVRNLIIVSSIGMCVASVITLILYEYTLVQRNTIIQKQWSESQLEEQIKHYNNLMMTQGQVKRIRHDLKNHLLAIRSIITKDDKEECLRYVDNLLNSADLSKSYIDSGNTVIDAIINAKKTEAEKQEIDFRLKIRIPENLPMSPEDECVIFGNALDNAIEAASKIPENRYVDVSLVFDKDTLMCRISNPYIGDIQSITTKNDMDNHGIGKFNMKKVLEKYKCVSKTTHEDNVYTLILIIMGLTMTQ